MSRRGEGILASLGTIGAFVVPGLLCLVLIRSAKGYLHWQGVVCIGKE
jgi:hypothetical protein